MFPANEVLGSIACRLWPQPSTPRQQLGIPPLRVVCGVRVSSPRAPPVGPTRVPSAPSGTEVLGLLPGCGVRVVQGVLAAGRLHDLRAFKTAWAGLTYLRPLTANGRSTPSSQSSIPGREVHRGQRHHQRPPDDVRARAEGRAEQRDEHDTHRCQRVGDEPQRLVDQAMNMNVTRRRGRPPRAMAAARSVGGRTCRVHRRR
jgi:hypothetical protein